MDKYYYKSDIGLIELFLLNSKIVSLSFVDDKKNIINNSINKESRKVINILDEYFKKKRTSFNIELVLNGTNFQKKVWSELIKIPYGKIVSYKDIALKLGDVKLSRAVANAISKNNIAIIIPCHRVIRSDGFLGGYKWGLDRKKALLNLENEKYFGKDINGIKSYKK
jgi:methylated-DNA-[protein]-cysteine S-methyltransferase